MTTPTPNTPITLDFDEADFILSALTAPIEKIEGLDEALEFTLSHDGEVNLGDIPIFVEAATRYAQGRTQNVPEITGEMFYMAMYKDKGAIWAANECQDLWNTFAANLKAMLSAAPPVTAPIEKVDGLAEVLAARDGTSMDHDMDYFYDNLDKVIEAARLQLQRQGD